MKLRSSTFTSRSEAVATRFEALNLVAMRIALDRHNVRCPLPAQGILLNPVDHDLLGWERLWGLPVQPDARVATRRVRVACEGSADNVEEELEELLREAEGKGL